MTVAFTVFGVAAPGGSKRAIRHKTTGNVVVMESNPIRSRAWRSLVADVAGMAMDEATGGRMGLLRGPLVLEATFYFPRPKGHFRTGRFAGELKPGVPLYPATRPDSTKLTRLLEDSLNGLVWKDDAQVVNQWVRKMYGEPARCEVRVEELDQ
jgi:Holliday junction resolvase RusA-like endonuclease